MMGGTCFTSFYSSFIQDLHSTGSPGVPLLKADYTKKRRRRWRPRQQRSRFAKIMAKYSLSIAATTILLVFAILSCSE